MIDLIKYPQRETWHQLVERPTKNAAELDDIVIDIMANVKQDGDKALLSYTEKIDNVSLTDIKVSQKEIEAAESVIDPELKAAISLAKDNIEKFHRSQLVVEPVVETIKGVRCWRKNIPIERVGLYIPGGSAPLFSTVLMLGIPAILSGCKEIILCTPPDQNGGINPLILYTAKVVGISKIYKAGGAQAIAGMAYGTESIPKVDKIFGPGNQYVTKAKELAQRSGVSIDMPAGPSELLIIADKTCNPRFVAADLLSQAEHGPDSQVILLSDDEDVAQEISAELAEQLPQLPRKTIAERALTGSVLIVLNSLEECMDFSNLYAPEHLILTTRRDEELADRIINAGSVFIGKYSCESAGDYASGTNHTLPTNGYARNYSGVSTDSFVKKVTFQELTAEGLQSMGPAIELMAEAESLYAHKNAVTIRLNELKDV